MYNFTRKFYAILELQKRFFGALVEGWVVEVKVYNHNINQLRDNTNFCVMAVQSSSEINAFFWHCFLVAFVVSKQDPTALINLCGLKCYAF